MPELLGWHSLVAGQSADESFYPAFLVGLHVATAIALVIFYWRDWMAVIAGFFASIRHRRIQTPAQRMAWLLVIGTIPVGVVGLVFEHNVRTVFANHEDPGHDTGRDLDTLGLPEEAFVGSSQILALSAGVSRSGVTMVAGLLRGLQRPVRCGDGRLHHPVTSGRAPERTDEGRDAEEDAAQEPQRSCLRGEHATAVLVDGSRRGNNPDDDPCGWT